MAKDKQNSNAPYCCGQPAVWVNMGKWLQYWFCKKCKKEVEEGKSRWSAPKIEKVELKYTGISGFLGGIASGALIPPVGAPITPCTPLTFNEKARAGSDPCYSDTHYWPDYTDFCKGAACNCGSRFYDVGQNLQAPTTPLAANIPPVATPLAWDEGVMVGLSPCAHPNHYWLQFSDYSNGYICNCGKRKGQSPVKGIP